MNRREFTRFAGGLGLVSIFNGLNLNKLNSKTVQASGPNIILIFADDLGFGDVGYHGCKDIPTPNIDSIAANGISFSAGYSTAPVCGPSRAGLMTGKYQNRFGFEDNPGPYRQGYGVVPGTPLSQKNIAERLKKIGYTTALFGKWHEGRYDKFLPHNRGFDEFFGFNDGSIPYFVGNNKEKLLVRNGVLVESEKRYITYAFSQEAISFIKKNSQNPFFIYLPFNAPHNSLAAPKSVLEKFSNITDPKRRKFAAVVHSMDTNIGRILKALRELNIEDNTLIIFISDNGGKPDGNNANFSFNTPFKGMKGTLYEGGIRVPFCMQWKSNLRGGQRYDHPVSTIDILPTVISAAGGQVKSGWGLDGVNLLPYLTGKKTTAPHKFLYWRFLHQWAIRNDKWKLVKIKYKEPEKLYKLSEDKEEKYDLAYRYPQIAMDLKRQFDIWASTLMPPQWGWQPKFCGKIKIPEEERDW